MSSIRNRLTILIIAGMAILMLIAGAMVDYLLREQLKQEFDRNLLSKAMTLVTLTEQEWGEIEFDFVDQFMPEFDADERPEYFQLWLTDGTLIARSGSLGEADLPHTNPPLSAPRFSDLTLPDGRAGRLVEVRFVPYEDRDDEDEQEAGDQDGQPAAAAEQPDRDTVASASDLKADIAVARGTEDLVSLITTVRTTLVLTFVLLMGAAALLVRLSVDRGLKPLNNIASEVRNLDADNLNTRLPDTPGSEELVPITRQLNDLLERLEAAFQRERRFSGNVAHELRTPITELRTMAEVGRQWPADREMVQGFFSDLVDLANDMERTVNNLMMLSQLDAGTQRVELESINLSRFVDKTWRRLVPDADRREVRLDNRVRDDLEVNTDGDKLRLILINLLSNAVSYSPNHSVIVVESENTETGARLAVSNPTVDLCEQDLAMMFERFWRKDEARTGGRHAGLGLSLVQALADALSLKVDAALDRGRRFTIILSEFQYI